MDSPWHCKNRTVHYHFCQRTFQREEKGGCVGQQVLKTVNDFQCNYQLPLEKCLRFVQTCEEKKVGCKQVVLLSNEYFIPWYKQYSSGWPTYGDWTYTESAALNMKLWPRFKISRWPSYRAITTYDITGIFQFHTSIKWGRIKENNKNQSIRIASFSKNFELSSF
jgi:hypothetical protein